MKKFALSAIAILVILTFSTVTEASIVSKWQLFITLKVKGLSHSLEDVARFESDGTVQLRKFGSLGTWSRTDNKLNLTPDTSSIQTLINNGFNEWMIGFGHSSGSLTINTIVATGKFLSDSMIQGLVRADVNTTIDGEVSKNVRVSLKFIGVECKNGTISGTVNAPHCGCVEARNLATDEIYHLGWVSGVGSYGLDEETWCDDLLPPGSYEVCLRCGSDICKSPITVGEHENVTVNFP